LLLSACGGGGDASTTLPAASTAPPPLATTIQLNGIVMDGPIEGAQVFLDLNNNQVRANDVPISAPSGAKVARPLQTVRLTDRWKRVDSGVHPTICGRLSVST
jgi:hypothetical protein